MPLYHIFIVYLIGTLIVFLPSFGLAKLFTKAGEASWKAYIPFYNTWVMQDLAKRPKHWVFWQFIPVVGWFISPGIFIEFAKIFGRWTSSSIESSETFLRLAIKPLFSRYSSAHYFLRLPIKYSHDGHFANYFSIAFNR